MIFPSKSDVVKIVVIEDRMEGKLVGMGSLVMDCDDN